MHFLSAPKTGGGVKKAYKWNEKNDLLGSGNFADVYRAQRDTSVKRIYKDYADNEVDIPQMVAVKVIDKSKAEDMEDVRREIDVMTRVPVWRHQPSEAGASIAASGCRCSC